MYFASPPPEALPCGRGANLLTDFRAHVFGSPPQKALPCGRGANLLTDFRAHVFGSPPQKLCHAVAAPIYSPISARMFLVPLPKSFAMRSRRQSTTGELGLRFAVARLGLSQELAQLLPLRL